MNKKKLLLLGALCILGILVVFCTIFFFQLTDRNPFFYLLVLGLAGTPIVFFFRELGKGVKPNNTVLKFLANWPLFVWCFGMALSVLYAVLMTWGQAILV